MRFIIILFLVVNYSFVNSQNQFFGPLAIADSLSNNAYSVVRKESTKVFVTARDEMKISVNRVITILNPKGLDHLDAFVYYDPSSKITALEAIVFDSSGEELQKIKKNDFEDISVGDGVSLYNDNRVLYLDYTPTQYPFTVQFSYTKETGNTGIIPRWLPYKNSQSAILESSFEVHYAQGLGFKYNVKNEIKYPLEIIHKTGYFKGNVKNLKPFLREAMSPPFLDQVPVVKFGLDYFHLEGVDGIATDWKSFGEWMNTALLNDVRTLPGQLVEELNALVKGVVDAREKAKIVYEYMQDRTRYISVQMGIGGWKPDTALNVHNLGYGDCKGLSNYTKAMLDAVGVPSNYIVLFGSRKPKNIDRDFVTMQGNHVILALPYNGDYLWMECTDQEVPFGHIAGFTDNRDVLVIDDENSKIVHSKSYLDKQNSLNTTAKLEVDTEGFFRGTIDMEASGYKYDQFNKLYDLKSNEIIENITQYWGYLNSLKVKDANFNFDKNNEKLSVKTQVEVGTYLQKMNNEYLVIPNVFNRHLEVPKKYRNREQSFVIDRGGFYKDTLLFKFPESFRLKASFESRHIKSEFGEYQSKVIFEDGELKYYRTFLLKSGQYSASKYKAFRSFIRKIIQSDTQKLIFTKH